MIKHLNRGFFWVLLLGFLLGPVITWYAVEWQLGVPDLSTVALAQLIEYKKRAAQKISGPKIMIMAGSSSLLGIRADLIERITGIPTINFGASAALGISTCGRWVQQVAHPGDTVLLAFEYDLYDCPDLALVGQNQDGRLVRYNLQYVDYLVSYEPDFYQQLGFLDKFKVLLNFPNRRIVEGLWLKMRSGKLHQAQQLLTDPEQTPPDTDRNGDRINILAQDRPKNVDWGSGVPVLIRGFSSPRPSGFVELDSFITWCRAHQVKVLATWPNLAYRPEYLNPKARETIQSMSNFYQSEGVPVLGEYTEALLPESAFFNSAYHLTDEAAITRTEHLLQHWPRN